MRVGPAVMAALCAAGVQAQDAGPSSGTAGPPTAPVENPGAAVPAEAPMTLPRLWAIVLRLDAEAERIDTRMRLTVGGVPVLIVTDPRADRMRAMVPIRSVAGMTAAELARVLEANFDTALDARYAIAQGRLWSVFIHPLSPLEQDQFLSGLGQTVNIALSYGSSYSGGALTFMEGDTGARLRGLIDDLLKRGQDL